MHLTVRQIHSGTQNSGVHLSKHQGFTDAPSIMVVVHQANGLVAYWHTPCPHNKEVLGSIHVDVVIGPLLRRALVAAVVVSNLCGGG